MEERMNTKETQLSLTNRLLTHDGAVSVLVVILGFLVGTLTCCPCWKKSIEYVQSYITSSLRV